MATDSMKSLPVLGTGRLFHAKISQLRHHGDDHGAALGVLIEIAAHGAADSPETSPSSRRFRADMASTVFWATSRS